MKVKRLMILLFAIFVASELKSQQNSSNRVALVIGVQNYSKIPALRHSLNDAQDISAILKAKGFQVESLYDPKTKVEIREAILRYYNKMKGKTGAVGIIYYAGHGTQNEAKENYLIPATAEIQLPSDLDNQCVKMNVLMSVLNSSTNLNILLLDACRTNSLPSFGRDVVQGLSKENAPQGSIVVCATQPGKIASDGYGRNGLFTSKLLKYINEPELNIGEVFRKVKQDVFVESGNTQLPSLEDNSFGDEFYFEQQIVTSSSSQQKKDIVKLTPTIASPTFDYGYGTSDATTVKVGSQIWIAKNLNVSTFSNGDTILEAKTLDEWRKAGEKKRPAWCNYNNDPVNGHIYGKLYNWYAVNDPRGLPPKGWHVPSEEEWKVLVKDYLTGSNTTGFSLKSAYGWLEDGNGNNRSGIGGLPGGNRINGSFEGIGKLCYWWTSTEGDDEGARFQSLGINTMVITGYVNKSVGFSVRCIKD